MMSPKSHRNSLDQSLLPKAATRPLDPVGAPDGWDEKAEWEAYLSEKRGEARRRAALGWAWKAGLAACLMAAIVGLHDPRPAAAGAIERRAVPSLRPPVKLTSDQEALYWTYALYDFDRLKAEFGAPAKTALDAGAARGRLRELLPLVSRRTQFTVRGYLPRGRIDP